MQQRAFRIASAATADDVADVARLFRQYAASLDVDLQYQDFEAEVSDLPGRYAPPRGTLLLVRDADGAAIGCVGMRPLDLPDVCEMKRLYLVDAARGRGAGRALVEAVVEAARAIGYREVRLDTLPSMAAAARLYELAGFARVLPYYETPIEGTLFFAKRL